jgi:lipopolysaccharide transport system ATP-binding protein
LSERVWADPETAPGTAGVRLKRIAIDSDGTGTTSIGRPFHLEIQYWKLDVTIGMYPSVMVKTVDDTVVLNTMPRRFVDESRMRRGVYTCRCSIPASYFNDDRYVIQLYFIREDLTCECRLDDIFTFELVDDLPREGWHGKWLGVVRPDFEWNWSRTELEK